MPKSGFATIIGRPNVGKSTLMNTLIGQKLAITSYKPQTTRSRMRAVFTDGRGQIVFLDTPGMKNLSTKLGTYMERAAEGTLSEVDVILYLVEPQPSIGEGDRAILGKLEKVTKPVILVINKIDKVKKADLLRVIDTWREAYPFADIIPLSATKRQGTEELLDVLFRCLPEGEPFYDEETVTDSTEREITAEIIREKALRLLQDEVPHGIAVTVGSMKERETKSGVITDIDAEIITERNAHKAIIIGKGGAMIKKIGTAARKDIEELLQTQVNLKLFVKVREDWRDNEKQLSSFGYDIRKL